MQGKLKKMKRKRKEKIKHYSILTWTRISKREHMDTRKTQASKQGKKGSVRRRLESIKQGQKSSKERAASESIL